MLRRCAAGPTPDSMSNCGRGNGPGTQDNLITFNGKLLATAFDHHPGRPCALKHQAQGEDIGLHGQVEAMACRAQVGQGGAHAHAVRVVHGERSHPGGLRMIHVRIMREVGIETGLIEGRLRGLPGVACVAPYGQGAITTVYAAASQIHVGFHLAKVRQHLRVGPLVVAPLRPLVIVLRGATQDYLTVDRAGAPDRFATWHQHGFRLMRIGCAGKGPVVRTNEGRGRVVAVFQIRREMRKVRIVRTGFQEQDRACTILGQSGRQHVTGRPGPNHNDVIAHGVSSTARPRSSAPASCVLARDWLAPRYLALIFHERQNT